MPITKLDCCDCGNTTFALSFDPANTVYDKSTDEAFAFLTQEELEGLYYELRELLLY